MSEQPVEPTKTPVELRQEEVDQYQANINLYTAVVAGLPSEWPDHLVQYKGRTDKHAAIAEIDDLEDVVLVSDLWAHDQAVAAIRAETVEMRKAQSILNALIAQQ
jgi:hypothetical protein